MNIYNSSIISAQLARRYPIGALTSKEKNNKLQAALLCLKEFPHCKSISAALFFAYLASDDSEMFEKAQKCMKKSIFHHLETLETYPFPEPKYKPEVGDAIDMDNFDRYVDYKESSPELLTPHVAIFFIQQNNSDFIHSALRTGGVNPNHIVGETSLLRIAAALLKVDFVKTLLTLKADPNLTSPLEAIAKPMAPSYHTQQISIARDLLCQSASPLSRFEGSSPKEGGYSLAELAEGKDQKSVEPGNVNNTLVALFKKKELLHSDLEKTYTTLMTAQSLDEKFCLYKQEAAIINLIAQFLLAIIRSDNS